MDFKEQLKNAGIVGAGGAGFPAYAKLAQGADLLVVNGAECEPLLYTDYYLLLRELPMVLDGIQAVLKQGGIESALLCVKAHTATRLGLTDGVKLAENVSLKVLPDVYPMGDEIFKGIESYDLNGNKVNDKIFKGKKLTMVNIWGTFCSACISEMPNLQALSEEYADKDFQIIGIVCDTYADDEARIKLAKEICKDTGAEYVSIVASASLDAAILDTVMSVPTTFFLNEKGEQFDQNYIGSKGVERWRAIIDSIYAEMEQ